MTIIKNQSAIKAFYYLMAIDGLVQDEEIKTLDRIGADLDGEHFSEYRDAIIESCNSVINQASKTEDSYDILVEEIDKELSNQTDDAECGISSRMLVWNMLVLSLANGDYDKSESRILRHIVRYFKIEESVFLEMEQLIQSFAAVDNELNSLQSSNLPYSEIRPLVDELENRKKNLSKHASQLVADEIVTPVEAYVAKEDVVDKARSAYHKATDPFFGKVKSSVGSAFDKVKEKAAPATDSVKQGFGKAWGGLKSKFGKKKENEPETTTEPDSAIDSEEE